MENKKRKYKKEEKGAYDQKPFIKPPRISFWNNIFYWLWRLIRHGFPGPFLCDGCSYIEMPKLYMPFFDDNYEQRK